MTVEELATRVKGIKARNDDRAAYRLLLDVMQFVSTSSVSHATAKLLCAEALKVAR